MDYPSDWNRRRKQVYKRDDFECQNCGRDGGPAGPLQLHAHHIVPNKSGGSHRKSNLITVCEECHDAIHNDNRAPTANDGMPISNVGPTKLVEVIEGLQEFLEYAQHGLSVEEPGQIKHEKLEAERVSLIQDLGKLSIKYDAPDSTRQQAMDAMLHSYIQLLKYPEDVWAIAERDSLSKEQAKRLGKELTRERSEECAGTTREVLSLGVESFFE